MLSTSHRLSIDELRVRQALAKPWALRRLHAIVGICLASTTVTAAPPQTDGGSPSNISIQFTAVAWEHELNDIEVRGGKSPERLSIPAFALSRTYRYSGANPMVVTRYDQVYAKSNPDYKPVTREVSIPSDWKRVIFLIAPTPDGSFAVKPIKDDVGEFPAGSVRIVNACGEMLAIKAGGKSQRLPPQENLIFKVPSGENQLGFIYARQDGDGWRPIGSNAFPVALAQRRTVFITKSNAETFQRYSQGLDDSGRLVTSKLPARAFQIFSITDTAGAPETQ